MSASPSPPANGREPLIATPGGVPEDARQAPATDTAVRSVAAHVRLWGVVAAGLVLDLWSKWWAFSTLGQDGHRPLVPHVLEFHTTLNPGALFGIGAGHTEVFLVASLLALALVVWMFAQSPARRWLNHVALGAILAGALGNMYDRAFVSLVEYPLGTPGGLVRRCYVPQESVDGRWLLLHEYPPSNERSARQVPIAEADRLPRPRGYVRDFIKIPTRWLGGRDLWPWVFNVADMLLVGGVGILAFHLLRHRERGPTRADPPMVVDEHRPTA